MWHSSWARSTRCAGADKRASRTMLFFVRWEIVCEATGSNRTDTPIFSARAKRSMSAGVEGRMCESRCSTTKCSCVFKGVTSAEIKNICSYITPKILFLHKERSILYFEEEGSMRRMSNTAVGLWVAGALGLGIAYLLYREYKQHSNEETSSGGTQTYTMTPTDSTPSVTPTSSPSTTGVASGQPSHVIRYHDATGANGVPMYYFSACPTLQVGDRGPMVTALQKSLSYLGFGSTEVNGVFGNATADAVRRFQSYMGCRRRASSAKRPSRN